MNIGDEMKTPVDTLYEDFTGILKSLENDLSLRIRADDIFRKFLLLAAASYFEKRLTETVEGFVAKATSDDHVLTHLVRKKAVERQYHAWFDWERQNANKFFAMFGDGFRSHMIKELDENSEDIKGAIQAFMEIGRNRNLLVHGDLGAFSLEKKSEEVYEIYKRALVFVEWFPGELAKFTRNPPPSAE